MMYLESLKKIVDFFPHPIICCILSAQEGTIQCCNKHFELFFKDLNTPLEGASLSSLLYRMGLTHSDTILENPPDGEARIFTLEKRSFMAFKKTLSNGDFSIQLPETLYIFFWSEIPYQQGEKYDLLLHEIEVILDSISDGIWVIDANGLVLYTNKALKRITGIDAKDVIGRHVTEPMTEGLYATCPCLDVIQTGKAASQFDDYANGVRCLNTATPILNDSGEVTHVVSSIRDMTELENLQNKLAKAELEASKYKKELEQVEYGRAFVGASHVFINSMEELKKLAKSNSCVLLLGETGTGKSVAASYIHNNSSRKDKPFISINCAAISESLIDSELFGYQKGAFTGADPQGKKGFFELANDGTLFLDEIGELPLNTQAKLLHVLDNYTFHKVGGNTTIQVNVRIIAATNKPLKDLIETGAFRKDLFYRLHILSATLPPLRERAEDIPLLAKNFLAEACQRLHSHKSFEKDALVALCSYSWPGNIRELRGAIEYLVAMTENSIIRVEDIEAYILKNRLQEKVQNTKLDEINFSHKCMKKEETNQQEEENVIENSTISMQGNFQDNSMLSSLAKMQNIPANLNDAVAEFEKFLISNALSQSKNTYKAADMLGISQSTVFRKAKALGIKVRS